MGTHDYLLKIYQTPLVRSILRRTGCEILLKDVYWWYRGKRHGTSRYTICNNEILFESYAAPTHPETEIIDDLMSKLEPDDVFYDIGSDRGWYSCFASQVLTAGNIVAFEPHPARRRVLKRNLEHNEITHKTTLRPEALSDINGTAEFGYAIEVGKSAGEFEAELARGDELINRVELPNPTVLKIDVEGAEHSVLKGLEKTISTPECRLVYVELHSNISEFGGSWDAVRDILKTAGFEITELQERGPQLFLRGEKY